MPLTIAVYSDIVCPWCHLGKKRLERGLELAGFTDAEVVFLPYELNPDMPAEGMDRTAYLDAKYGAERRLDMERRLTEAAFEDGVAFNWPLVTRAVNTRKAHVLIALANALDLGVRLKGDLMTAYFEQGRDVSDEETLLEIGEAAGLDRAQMQAALLDKALAGQIETLEQHARRIGVQGVPFFIVNNRYGLSGAQPAGTWAEALPRIAAETAASDAGPPG